MFVARRDEIKRRREAEGLTGRRLSQRAGLPDNAITRIENGDSEQTHPLRARAIAEALKCKVTDIFDEPDKQKGARTQ